VYQLSHSVVLSSGYHQCKFLTDEFLNGKGACLTLNGLDHLSDDLFSLNTIISLQTELSLSFIVCLMETPVILNAALKLLKVWFKGLIEVRGGLDVNVIDLRLLHFDNDACYML